MVLKKETSKVGVNVRNTEKVHCVESVCIQSYSDPNWGKRGPE